MAIEAIELSEVITITTTGSSGSATGNATTIGVQHGFVYACDIDYGAAPATTVVTISAVGAGADGSDRTLFATAAGNTDGFTYPRKLTSAASNGAAEAASTLIAVPGVRLKVTVTLADNGNTVKVRFTMLR